jgi:hypothetical protein
MIYIVDLDYTLLDTKAFKQAMQKGVGKFGITTELFDQTYKQTIDGRQGQYDYDAVRHASYMSKESGVEPQDLQAALVNCLERVDDFLYPDSIEFLKWLRGLGGTALLTWGNPQWQKKKVERSKIHKLFDNYVYSKGDKSAVELSFSDSETDWVFINDNPKEILEIKKRYPQATHLRIKRLQGKQFPKEIDNIDVPTFSNLLESKNYISSINK